MRVPLIASPAAGAPDIAHADALVLAGVPAFDASPTDRDAASAARRDGFRGGLAETPEAAALLAEAFGRGPVSRRRPSRRTP